MLSRGGIFRAGPGETDWGRDAEPVGVVEVAEAVRRCLESCGPSKSHRSRDPHRLEQLPQTGRLSSHCFTY